MFDCQNVSRIKIFLNLNFAKLLTKIKLDQGLLYLDGRNSQKYLHPTQANF